MRSCKYSKVPDWKDKRTSLLCLRNFRFFKDNKEITNNPSITHTADCVSITFELQKNQEKHETVTQDRNEDSLLCPVKAWAKVFNRVSKYKHSTSNTPINILQKDNKLYQITSKDNINFLRKTVRSMTDIDLGFEPNEIGTHSIRSGGAMAMKLANISDSTIRLIGRWKSDSFLKYIRIQIKQFSSQLSSRMLEHEHFTHIPNFDHTSSPSKLRMAPSPGKTTR